MVRTAPSDTPTETQRSNGAVIRPLRFAGDDQAFVAALKAGHQDAFAALYDRYANHVQRVLVRILGFDPAIGDLLQEVFLQALGSIGSLRDADRLQAWLTRVAVFTARGCIRRRSRRRWLRLAPPEGLPVQVAPEADEETREALRLTYEVLERLPAEERIAFSLRFIEGLELTEVADACDVSLATIKRKLAKAEQRFVALARHRGPLADWLEQSARWRDR
jgi:RNA polymerase sigma-70 factor (ECF subfamily)